MKPPSEELQVYILKIVFSVSILVNEDFQPAVQCLVNDFDHREAFCPRKY
jgi:hypothetical protein